MGALGVVKKFFPDVKSVEDAVKRQVVQVRANDAKLRGKKKHDECALAEACKRSFAVDGVIISRSMAYLVKGKKAVRFKLPDSVSREIVSFDRGAGFQPGVYALEAIPPSSRMDYRAKRDDLRDDRDRTNKGKAKRHITTNVRSVLGGQKA